MPTTTFAVLPWRPDPKGKHSQVVLQSLAAIPPTSSSTGWPGSRTEVADIVGERSVGIENRANMSTIAALSL